MNDVILQRITDVELAEWCNKYGLGLAQVTPYQLRIEGLIDFYPKRNRYFVLKDQTWHTAQTIDDLRKSLIDVLPEFESGLDIPKLKEWYYHLTQQEHSDFIQGQISMLSNVLQMVLSEEEYEKVNNMPDNDAEAKMNGQEQLV